MAIQSGTAADHCSWLISDPAEYTDIGSIPFGPATVGNSQINAWVSSPAEQICLALWGAQEIAFTLAACLSSSATGIVGDRISKITTLLLSIKMVAIIPYYDLLTTYFYHQFNSPKVLLVPGQPKKRRIRLGALVDDRGVLLVPEIEDPNGPIGGNGGENPSLPPGDVVDLLVMGDELGLDNAPLNIPDGTGSVDARGPQAPGLDVVPVEGGVVEGERRDLGLEGQGVGVEGEHVHAVVEGLEEATHGNAVGRVGDCQGVERVGGLVGYGVRVFEKGVLARMLHFSFGERCCGKGATGSFCCDDYGQDETPNLTSTLTVDCDQAQLKLVATPWAI
ncbi:hypothetical protein FH972_016156 [Carpinus fangiana]|uniref:Uncharacterized protein n=1 Tax=Carpinus fangiana TaxID=176857 RepID=A0A5N6RG44_9ROSI|nr:hypothetical protein FH972_016156 [Carpinus fangiana]